MHNYFVECNVLYTALDYLYIDLYIQLNDALHFIATVSLSFE